MNAKNTLASLQKWLLRNLPIYDHIGATVEEIGETTRCRVPLNSKNKNHFGAVHAALQFAVMEMAGGLAGNRSSEISSGNYLLVVKSLKIEFVKPALSDVEAVVYLSDTKLSEIEESLRSEGKVEFELDCELLDESGEVASKSVAVYYASKRKADS